MSRLITRHVSARSLRSLPRALLGRADAPDVFDSASSALGWALARLTEPGEVIVPAYTCDRVVRAVIGAGRTPVFGDVDPTTGVMTAATAAALTTPSTRAVVPTHIYGNAPDMKRFVELAAAGELLVVEDAALTSPGHGLDAGAPAVYSFGRGKLAGFGAGGLLRGAPPQVGLPTARYSSLRSALSMLVYLTPIWSAQTRLARRFAARPQTNDVTGAIEPHLASRATARLVEQTVVDEVDNDVSHRAAIDAAYGSGLRSLTGGSVLTGAASAQSPSPGFALLLNNRDKVRKALFAAGIDSSTAYDYSAGSLYTGKPFPASEGIANRILVLPNHRFVTAEIAREAASVVLETAG